MLDKQQDIALAELGVSITKIPEKSAQRDLKTWISGQELSTEEIQGLYQVFGLLSQELVETTSKMVSMTISASMTPEKVVHLFKMNNIFRELVRRVLIEKGYAGYDTKDTNGGKSVLLEVIK